MPSKVLEIIKPRTSPLLKPDMYPLFQWYTRLAYTINAMVTGVASPSPGIFLTGTEYPRLLQQQVPPMLLKAATVFGSHPLEDPGSK